MMIVDINRFLKINFGVSFPLELLSCSLQGVTLNFLKTGIEEEIKMKIISIFVFFVTFVAFVHSQQEKNTLVLLDNLATRETHSIFFKSLQGKKL